VIITKEQAQELIKYFNNQFIDRNSKVLYDGEILNELLKELNRFLNSFDECGARHPDGYSICRLRADHGGGRLSHHDTKTQKSWP